MKYGSAFGSTSLLTNYVWVYAPQPLVYVRLVSAKNSHRWYVYRLIQNAKAFPLKYVPYYPNS